MSTAIFKNSIVATGTSVPEQPSPQIEVAIRTVLFMRHGPNIRIRSIKLLKSPAPATDWTTQGRVKMHTSHNLRAAS